MLLKPPVMAIYLTEARARNWSIKTATMMMTPLIIESIAYPGW